jgi:hypothetical protein
MIEVGSADKQSTVGESICPADLTAPKLADDRRDFAGFGRKLRRT